jgi:hypothetical protein
MKINYFYLFTVFIYLLIYLFIFFMKYKKPSLVNKGELYPYFFFRIRNWRCELAGGHHTPGFSPELKMYRIFPLCLGIQPRPGVVLLPAAGQPAVRGRVGKNLFFIKKNRPVGFFGFKN